MTTKTHKRFATIFVLPDELLMSVFEHLKIKDVIQCSMVCKRFKLLCQEVKIPELIISNRIENIKGYWFYTIKQFNHLDAIDVATFNSYRSTFRLDKFQRLNFEGNPSEYAQLQVNELTQLDQVKIILKKEEVGVRHKIHINLPNLKMLEIDTSSHTLFITTPKLKALRCTDFDVIHLSSPNTIKHLETMNFSESVLALKNLEFLLISFIGDDDRSDILSAFPKLTTLSCIGHHGWVPLGLENLIKHKRNHLLSQPKIYFLSVEMDDIEKIDEFNNVRPDDFCFQVNHYTLLADTVFRHYITYESISYSHLMKSMNGKVPDDFFKKYFRTQRIIVDRKVSNHEHLFQFLKNFEYLTELWLKSDSLDQSHWNRLDEFDQLTDLTIRAESSSTEYNVRKNSISNFNFVLKMRRLKYFSAIIDSAIFFDLALQLFTQLKYFELISFYYENNYVYISKNPLFNNYEISCYRYKKDNLDFNRLVQEADTIKMCPPIRD